MRPFLAVLLCGGLALAAPTGSAAPTAPDPEAAMQDFLRNYWDAEAGYFLAWNKDAPFARIGGAGPKGGKYADFWWSAQLWDLVMDAYERERGLEYRALIDRVYDGFVAQYPDWANDYNDDLGWWAQAALRAYLNTDNPRYLQRAKALFDDIWAYWDDGYGGGVSWRRSSRAQKNVATNGPLTVTAVRLYQTTGEAAYLDKARRLWAWVDERLTDRDARVWDNWENGELRRWDFTYNFGNFILASLALRETSGDARRSAELLERSVKAADWAMANLTNAGVLLDEGTGDGGGFKGVFVRAVRYLSQTQGLDSAKRDRYVRFLDDNATQVWNSRRPDGLTGPDWAAVQERGVVESLAAASATAALQLAPGPLAARYVGGDGRYEAENSRREGPGPSVAAPGYSGRGYLNGFFKDGQWVEFRVNLPEARAYAVRLRYSAGGGAAVRWLAVGDRASRLEFPATPDWRTWATLETRLELPAGASTLRLSFDRRSGSRNWLNLDSLSIVLEPR